VAIVISERSLAKRFFNFVSSPCFLFLLRFFMISN